MTSPILRPVLDSDRIFVGAPDRDDATQRALALTVFRDLQAAGMISGGARFEDKVGPDGKTYERAIKSAISDANGNGRADVDLEALRSSGALAPATTTTSLESTLSGPRAPITDQFVRDKDPGSVQQPTMSLLSWGSCGGTPGLTPRGQAMTGPATTLTSDLDARVKASPEEAQKVAKESIASAQLLDQTKRPVDARQTLLRSAGALYDAGRLAEAEPVYRELASPKYASAAAPAGSGAATCGALADGRLADIDQRLSHLSPEELQKLGPRGAAYVNDINGWIDGEVAAKERTIAAKNDEPGACEPLHTRIDLLKTRQRELTASLRAGAEHGQDLFTLSNVVVNEAGVTGDASKNAIAYAYLNRTEGTVRDPIGDEVSHFVSMETRWGREGTAGKLTLLDQIPGGIDAANARLSDPEPKASDPTGGADHWVSPIGLVAEGPKADTHFRDYDGLKNVPFPYWARDPAVETAEVAALKGTKQLYDNYREITVESVPGREFLFYTGVNKGNDK